MQYSGSFLYPACITFVKLSILMQYRRLFSHHSRSFHWQINVLITLVALWGGGIILTAFFLCVPMEKNWNTSVEGTCIPIIPFYYGLQIPNIVTDLLIIVVPIREVMKLALNKRLKTGAITMFALGIVTLVFDIIRLVALLEVTAPGKMLDFTCKFFHFPFKLIVPLTLQSFQITSSTSQFGRRSSPQSLSSQSVFPVSEHSTVALANPRISRTAAPPSATPLPSASSSLRPTIPTSKPQKPPALRPRVRRPPTRRQLRRPRSIGRRSACCWIRKGRSSALKSLTADSAPLEPLFDFSQFCSSFQRNQNA